MKPVTHGDRPAAAAAGSPEPEHRASGNPDHSGTTAPAPLPRGVPLNTKDPRVQRAIADLLHPQRTEQSNKPSDDNGSNHGNGDGHHGGVLEQILRDLRKRTQQLNPDHHPSKDEGGLGILEMLK